MPNSKKRNLPNRRTSTRTENPSSVVDAIETADADNPNGQERAAKRVRTSCKTKSKTPSPERKEEHKPNPVDLEAVNLGLCPLCMKRISGNEEIISPVCGHLFHKACVTRHQGAQCPLCNRKIILKNSRKIHPYFG